MKAVLALLMVAFCGSGQTPSLEFLNHNQPLLDAHNCYPDRGQWAYRIERALSTGFPIVIEQDLTWSNGRAVVSHSNQPAVTEPTLRDYFFERVRPIVEKALAVN